MINSSEKFISQLEAFKNKLLNVSTRNKCVFLGKLYNKYSFDVGKFAPKASSQLLSFLRKDGGKIQLSSLSDESELSLKVNKILTTLNRTAEHSFDETGLKELYLGLFWLEGPLNGDTYVRGPLFLLPIKLFLKRSGKNTGWYIEVGNYQSLVVNKALTSAIKKNTSKNIPNDLDTILHTHFEESIQNENQEINWSTLFELINKETIHCEHINANTLLHMNDLKKSELHQTGKKHLELSHQMILGIFKQSSTALFADIEEMASRASQGELDQGIVDNILGTPADEGDQTDQAVNLDEISETDLNTVLPSDPSQDTIIIKSHSKDCVIVRGPPGTGKSQVIVNLISDAIKREKRILVVCQKRAALDVVYERLSQSGLEDVAIVVHDAETDLKSVLAKLNHLMTTPLPEKNEVQTDSISKNIDEDFKKLHEITSPLHQKKYGIELFKLYRRSNKEKFKNLQKVQFLVTQNEEILQTTLEKIKKIKQSYREYNIKNHLIKFRKKWHSVSFIEKNNLIELLEILHNSLSQNFLKLDIQTNYETIINEIKHFYSLKNKFYKIFLPSWYKAKKTKLNYPEINENNFEEIIKNTIHFCKTIQKLVPFFNPEELVKYLYANLDNPKIENSLSLIKHDFDKIQELDSDLLNIPKNILELIHEIFHLGIPMEDWENTILNETSLHWIESIEKNNPSLSGEPFKRYEEVKEQIKNLLLEKQKILKQEILYRIHERAKTPTLPSNIDHHPNRKASTDWNKLIHETSKKRRLKPLRHLNQEFEWPMQEITRCWLASPEVVSEIFPLKNGLFDLIIFDEASQLSVERSLPVLYRGKHIVIAGDEQQMPPSNFFKSITEEDSEEDSEDSELQEVLQEDSLLSIAKRIYNFDYLSWHYRSKYQELIEFSNHAFYDSKLNVAANIDRSSHIKPISWVNTQGVWENQTNTIEAQKSVDLLNQLLIENQNNYKSIGIITFNQKQQEMVQDLIESKRLSDDKFNELLSFAYEQEIDKRPFVKNIENVQGDQRDIIIISVSYAPDKNGILRKNFGPIGKQGGENRLNVCVTRAKKKMYVLCSFDPNSLNVDDSKNIGPKRLKQFLQYAKATHELNSIEQDNILKELNPNFNQIPRNTNEETLSDIHLELYKYLKQKGYEIETEYGNTEHKLDLAVIDPVNHTKYCLGVECDGLKYIKSKSLRERDLAKENFLTSRGWHLKRVWSRNWWNNKDREIKRITEDLPLPPHTKIG